MEYAYPIIIVLANYEVNNTYQPVLIVAVNIL